MEERPITYRNTQANPILERVHQTIGNIINTSKAQDIVFGDENPQVRIQASTIFALGTTTHTRYNAAYPSTIRLWRIFRIEHTSQSKLAVN